MAKKIGHAVIVMLLILFAVIIFGVYGPGYDAAQFIYGGF